MNKLKRVEYALKLKKAAKKNKAFITDEGMKRLDKIVKG